MQNNNPKPMIHNSYRHKDRTHLCENTSAHNEKYLASIQKKLNENGRCSWDNK